MQFDRSVRYELDFSDKTSQFPSQSKVLMKKLTQIAEISTMPISVIISEL